MRIFIQCLDLLTSILLSVYIIQSLLYVEIKKLTTCAILSAAALLGNIAVALLFGQEALVYVLYFNIVCFFGGMFFLRGTSLARCAAYTFLSSMIVASIERIFQDSLLVFFDLVSLTVPDFLITCLTLFFTCFLFLGSIPFLKQRFTNESHRVSVKFFGFIALISFVNFAIYYLCRECLYATDFGYFESESRCKLFLVLFGACLILEMFSQLYLYFEKTHSTIIQDFTKEYLAIERRHFEQMQEKEKDTRKFRHDIKNHLFLLQQYSKEQQYELLDSYLNTLNHEFDKTQKTYQTGLFAIDSLLNQKAADLEKADISLSLDCSLSAPCMMDDFSLVTIFSNAFSNAVEACENIAGAKAISITIRCTKEQFTLEMKNPVTHKIAIRNNHIRTTKAETHLHSFGLPQIEKTVQLLSGTFLLDCTEDEFMLFVNVLNHPVSY